eukprot:TRINITY_DN3896_c1_g1_i2.p1 TRINITY_DN3896_c1_g1~~TRINITY_DN3896_c1_g1_i2.p1  ORF type:complete len:475 (-),score=55.32 TRINITY_DN3896_c1_g1_i2:1159-2583(-)
MELNQVTEGTLGALGGKALRCWELTANGFSVPRAFVLSASVYREHLSPALTDCIETVMRGDDVSPEGLVKIREGMMALELQPSVQQGVEAFLHSLPGGTAVAVRSSGTLEDLVDASYAGQYLTVLNLKSLPDVLKAIKACWASMWEPHVLTYRGSLQQAHATPSMAVLIMAQIDSLVSGVAFTQNPITGSPSEFLIESVWGQGEGLVSGKLSPDNYVWNQYKRELTSSKIANKTHKFVLDSDNGVTMVPTSPDKAEAVTLTPDRLDKVTELCRNIAEFYREPQDIEWAFDQKGNLYVLQSRYITAVNDKTVNSQNTELFIAPGPGPWQLDDNHFPVRATTLMGQEYEKSTFEAWNNSSAKYGLLLHAVYNRPVNGFMYYQVVPVLDPTEAAKRIATHVEWVAKKQWRQDVKHFRQVTAPAMADRHRALQKVDLSQLNDSEFGQHLETCLDHVIASWMGHHVTGFLFLYHPVPLR